MKNALKPSVERLRADLNDRELWCLCIIAALLWMAR